MAGVVMVAATLAVVGILLWTFGSGLLRIGGLVLIIDGLGGIVIRGGSLDNHRFPIEVGVGVLAWLAGHWLFAAKHGVWRTRAARGVWSLPVVRWLAPVRTARA